MSDSTMDLYRRQGFGCSLGKPSRPGLLIIDFINGFADPAIFGGGNINEAIAATVPVLEMARAMKWPIAHARIVFADDGANANIFSIKATSILKLTEDSVESAFVPELQPAPGELVIRKTSPSAFFETNLRSWLTQHNVDSLLIAGCSTSGCVRASVHDAMCCGFRPYVLMECVGDRATAPHEANLFDMQQKYAEVLSFREFQDRLAGNV
ncbi:isochorismatase family protein [Glaciimonas sp. PCH181]|uniref:isochorismatase family protein n=1 Tax=Glaciimonas sp. PCH181 TaxID=2133943 RepID=UPI000D33857D|nr:isochorismatase family protein [Glaciimonas sp. PCH181]PUA19687.1 N-carbamoylsarcosine amidase [Glaciimonas sp. PCH181]